MGKWPLLMVCLAACSTVQSVKQRRPILSPALATTAGGTWITISGLPFRLRSPQVELGLRSGSGVVLEWIAAEDVGRMDSTTLKFKTPQFIEACADVRLTDGEKEVVLEESICFHTLAFTANQTTHDSTVVDAYANTTFTPSPSMAFGADFVPGGLALSQVYPPARTLYALDKATGDMSYYDVANFVKLGNLVLHDSTPPSAGTNTVFDLAVVQSGFEGFVTHVTAGTDTGTNPTAGGLSWIALDNDPPYLLDVDDDPDLGTTSPGAPNGYTRVKLCAGSHCEDGTNAYFYPLSTKVVVLSTDVPGYVFTDGEPWPGGYALVSGLGFKGPVEPQVRQVMVAVMDLNTSLYCDPALHAPRYCLQLSIYDCDQQGPYCNERYWRRRQVVQGLSANYKALAPDGCIDDPAVLGDTKHAMDFAPESGAPANGPTVYLANQHENKLYLFAYDTEAWDWYTVLSGGDPFTIATGNTPTGVKVQKVLDDTYAYITNAGVDTVTVVDTATNQYAPESPIDLYNCYQHSNHASSFDTRSTGNYGYSSNLNSDSVSVVDLVGGICYEPNGSNGAIELDPTSAPVDIVVQPVPETGTLFGQMMGMMTSAAPADYTIPEDQDEMIGDWKAIQRLVQTPASPQAIKAAIDAFLRKIDQTVTKDKIKKHLKQGAKLYKVAYMHEYAQ